MASTVNISFPTAFLARLDREAREETRSRSELLRAAALQYLERKERWRQIFAFGDAQARRLKLKPEDVGTWIAEYRRAKARRAA